MEAYIIRLKGHPYSEACALRCLESADIEIKLFDGVSAEDAERIMHQHGLRWTWARDNTAAATCPLTGLQQRPYGRLAPKIGCSMSHYLLWQKCAEADEAFLILEHDAVFLRPMPAVEFRGICQINDPAGATPYGAQWSEWMRQRGPGVFPKTRVMPEGRPDGLAGNSAYLLKPWAAAELVDAFRRYGVWPNDATMCIQLFPYLEELYPFVTAARQSVSTSS